MDMLSGKQITAANLPRRRRCQDVSDNRRSEHVRPSPVSLLRGTNRLPRGHDQLLVPDPAVDDAAGPRRCARVDSSSNPAAT